MNGPTDAPASNPLADDFECPEPDDRSRSAHDSAHDDPRASPSVSRAEDANVADASIPAGHRERQRTTNPPEMPTAAEIFGPMSGVTFTSRQPLNDLVNRAGLHHVTPTSPAEDLRDALEILKTEAVAARLDATDQATLHKLVLDLLAERKIRNARPLVRAAIGDLVLNGAEKDRNRAGGLALVIADEEPATEPADGAALLDQTSSLIRRR